MVARGIGPWCHRVERLVLVELDDLVQSKVYLEKDWETVDIAQRKIGLKEKKVECRDCEYHFFPSHRYLTRRVSFQVESVIPRYLSSFFRPQTRRETSNVRM